MLIFTPGSKKDGGRPNVCETVSTWRSISFGRLIENGQECIPARAWVFPALLILARSTSALADDKMCETFKNSKAVALSKEKAPILPTTC
jgi:hypothetical protein